MSELDFLLELLLDHELPDKSNKAIRSRIKTVQKTFGTVATYTPAPKQQGPKVIHGAVQSPSMIAAIERMTQEVPNGTPVVVAQTPAAQAAMKERAAAMGLAASGSPEKGMTSPRKFRGSL